VARARDAGLQPVDRLDELCAAAEIVISLCPPDAALGVARSVTAAGFVGVYLDANAVNPERMHTIEQTVSSTGSAVVDGCLIGPVPTHPGTTRLYLAGDTTVTTEIASLFAESMVEARTIAASVGAASALKIAHSSFAKTSRVLAALAHALAAEYGVGQALTDEAHRRSRPALAEPDFLPTVAARAWRWAPELAQSAESYRAAGLPDTMITGAEELLRIWSRHKDFNDGDVQDLLRELRSPDDAGTENS
jgi:3-hydroxyisobutyrate dehydrogenase-like beta-hydroxyacid dehydrogenase